MSKVVSLFEKVDYALSVVQLIKTFERDMNKTTVYRILERLEEQNVVHSFTGKDGLKWYANCKNNPIPNNSSLHPHFQCEVCEKSKCINVSFSIEDLPKYKVSTTNVLLTGICDQCS